MIDSFNRLSLRERTLVSAALLLCIVMVYMSILAPSKKIQRLSLAEQSHIVSGGTQDVSLPLVGKETYTALSDNAFSQVTTMQAFSRLLEKPALHSIRHIEFMGSSAYGDNSGWYEHRVQVKLMLQEHELKSFYGDLADSKWQVKRMAWSEVPYDQASLSGGGEGDFRSISLDMVLGYVNRESVWLAGKGSNHES